MSGKYIKTITEHPPQKSTIHRQLQSSTVMQKNRKSGIVFDVLSVSLINVRNGRRVFVVHLICGYCRARVVSCYIITEDPQAGQKYVITY
jgi:hypothetical protein